MGPKSRWVLGAAFALALLAPGCGDTEPSNAGASGTGGSGGAGSGSGGSAGKGSGVAGADDFERTLSQAFCARLFHCVLADDDDIGIKVSLGTEQRCVEMIAEIQSRDPRVLDRRAKLASGAIRFASDKVPACLAEAKSCDFANHRYNLTRSGPACRVVFEGSVPLGGACHRYEECAGNARCLVDQTCPGKCAARVALGQPCSQTPDCDETTGYVECRYDDASAANRCVRITSATPGKEGQPCSAAVATAETVTPCADGLWCEFDPVNPPSIGVCRAPLAAGAACDSSDDLCVDGYTCFDQMSCKPAAIGARAGDPCDVAAGSYCDPFARLSCVSGKCQTLGDGTSGSACLSSDIHELLDCQPGLRCAGNNPGTCTPLLAVDGACQANSECVSGTCASGKCTADFCEL